MFIGSLGDPREFRSAGGETLCTAIGIDTANHYKTRKGHVVDSLLLDVVVDDLGNRDDDT